jgi:hypothetical protein
MAVVVAGGAAAGPAALRALDAGGADAPSVLSVQLDAPPGCLAEPDGTRLRCGSLVVSARVVVFPARASWAMVVAERRRLASGSDVDTTFRVAPTGGAVWWDVRQRRDGGATAVATWLDGRPAGEGLRDRAAQAWNAASGGAALPVVIGLAVQADDGGGANTRSERDLLERVLEAQTEGLVARAREMSRRR